MKSGRIISMIFFLQTVIGGIIKLERKEIFLVCIGQLAALALIRFPDDVNQITLGINTRGGVINNPTPPVIITIFGWGLLLLITLGVFDVFSFLS